MIDRVLNSPAQECKRWLDLEENQGAKSNRKGNQRERGRAIQQRHYIVRQPEEKLYGLKSNSPSLIEGLNSTDLYHYFMLFQSWAIRELSTFQNEFETTLEA